jgi:hypothetical protein
MRHQPLPTGTARATLVGFLRDRLTEELAALWERDRPGLAAQVAVLDDLLTTLDGGELPERRELRVLLYGYGAHPAYDPAWSEL